MKKMFSSKRADLPSSTAVGLIVAIIMGIMILVWIAMPVAGELPRATSDGLCHLNAAIRNIPAVGKAVIPMALCWESTVKIDATDYSKCDPNYEELAKTNEEAALKKCAAHQIAKLVVRCWYRYGEGNFNLFSAPGNYKCSNFYVTNLGTTQISSDDFNQVMYEQNYNIPIAWAPYGNENKIKTDGDIQWKIAFHDGSWKESDLVAINKKQDWPGWAGA